MQSFYRRFVRDFMRYRDVIQCAGHELVQAVRGDSIKEDPRGGGKYYALHVRRGDFQYKDVKLSAEEIVRNLRFPNGTPIIPPGSLVYLSTDDPDGVCEHCLVNRQPCESYMKGSKPPGCPEDVSYNCLVLVFFLFVAILSNELSTTQIDSTPLPLKYDTYVHMMKQQ
jgi:GDP-fucose protein O-fucosyltransferase